MKEMEKRKTMLVVAIGAIIGSLLLIGSVKADADVFVGVATDGDVNLDTSVETNGSVSITIDGTNYPAELENTNNRIDAVLTLEDLTYAVKMSIDYINGAVKDVPSRWLQFVAELDKYFATDKDAAYLNDRINTLEQQNFMLSVRLEALENTMEDLNGDAYCQNKIDVMAKYGLTGVKCGKNSTWYYNTDKGSNGQTGIIGITPIYETTTTLPPCVENWTCSDWTECKNGTQSRECVDMNQCDTTEGKPAESQNCVEPKPQPKMTGPIMGTLAGMFTTMTTNPIMLWIH
jgi:uncharacterized protein (DUF1499 family)